MEYIHKSSMGYHGNLTSQNTLIDGHWVLKLTKFGLNTLKEKDEVQLPYSSYDKSFIQEWGRIFIIEASFLRAKVFHSYKNLESVAFTFY